MVISFSKPCFIVGGTVKRLANRQAASGGSVRGKLDLGKLYASCITLDFQGNVDPVDNDSRENDQ